MDWNVAKAGVSAPPAIESGYVAAFGQGYAL